MHSCCSLPEEVIASNQQKINEDCCLVTEQRPTPATVNCPVCKTRSRKVQRRTTEHLLKAEKVGAIQKVQYYYCTNPECKVVYFSNEAVPYFTVDDVKVKVFAKDRGDNVNVCYCFDWTRGRIKQQIEETGKSTASMEIAREVKAGNCECDIKNPKGECCLGDVNAVVKEAMKENV
ncbi:MAG: hypothetical protein WC879_00245 [Melioribacteraceae bacterium]